MNLRFAAFFPLLAVLVVLPLSASTISPNTTTPLGPGFHLDTTHVGGGPGLIDPCWFIGITNSTLPAVQSIDLRDPTRPVLNSIITPPNPIAPQFFRLYLGWIDPAAPASPFSFSVPTGLPTQNTDGTYDIMFTALDAAHSGGPSFSGLFHLDVGDGSVSQWSVLTPPPDNRGLSAFEIDFTVSQQRFTQDPALTFSLNETFDNVTVPLSFVPAVPEPGSLMLIGSILGVFAVVKGRK